MSTLLIAIAYPDRDTAEKVRGELIQATKEHLLTLEDAVVVEHEADGKIKLHQATSTTGAGAAGGALWGGLIGLLFLAPLIGMAIGAATGAIGGQGGRRRRQRQLHEGARREAAPGGAALIALGQADAREKVLERLQPLRRRRHPDLARAPRKRSGCARRWTSRSPAARRTDTMTA